MPSQTLHGSCLCGSLKYTVTGTPAKFYHCHCSRCRKSSGTGHASNMFVDNGELSWTGDTDDIQLFKLPEADRFSRSFCRHCGGPLPRFIPQLNVVMIPAGTLDDAPNISPQARIFLNSKAPWSCTGDKLPTFADYPA